MGFFYHPQRPKQTRQAQVMAVVISTIAATSGVVASIVAPKKSGAHGNTSTVTVIVIATVVALVVVMLTVGRNIARGAAESAADGDSPEDASHGGASSDRADEDRKPLVLVVAAVAALVGIVVALFAFSSTAHAQGAADRGAIIAMNGSDTVIVDRFSRTPHLLSGAVYIKGLARVEYVVMLGDGDAVRSLSVRQYKWAAAATDAPGADVLTTMLGDSATIRLGTNTTRFASKAGAIPSFNNAFAITELFTRRARATNGSGDYFYLAINAGVTLPATVRPAGADSAIFTIAGQQQRFKVDADGRILGGSIKGQPVVIKRVSAEDADKIMLGLALTKAAPPANYSAPPGAPYTAVEVSFKGPGGITLGGTLTLPLNASGKVPAALTITGSGQEDRDEATPRLGEYRIFRQVADTLSRRGIAVLRLDDRGLGASTGDFEASTTADFADDIRAGLAYLRSRPEIDGDRLALVGHSEGGIIAPMVASTDARLRAMVTLGAPGDKMIEMSMAQNKWILDHTPNLSQAKKDSILTAARASLQPEKQTVPMLKFWMSYDPGPAAKGVKASTLVLQGANDRQIPAENAGKLAALIRAGGNKDVTVRVFPNLDHLFLEDSTGDFRDLYDHVKTRLVGPAVLGAIADWLALKLQTSAIVK